MYAGTLYYLWQLGLDCGKKIMLGLEKRMLIGSTVNDFVILSSKIITIYL